MRLLELKKKKKETSRDSKHTQDVLVRTIPKTNRTFVDQR